MTVSGVFDKSEDSAAYKVISDQDVLKKQSTNCKKFMQWLQT